MKQNEFILLTGRIIITKYEINKQEQQHQRRVFFSVLQMRRRRKKRQIRGF